MDAGYRLQALRSGNETHGIVDNRVVRRGSPGLLRHDEDVSPVSRNRKKKSDRSRSAGRETSPFAPILRQAHLAREARRPIEVERWAAAVVGEVYLAALQDGADDVDIVMDGFHTELDAYLSSRKTPDSRAALRAFSLVGDPEERALFTESAERLGELGIADPDWVAGSQPLTALEAWHVGDPFGESEVIMVGFRRPEGDHALFALVDLVTEQGLVQLELLDVPPGGVRELIEAYRNTEGLTEPAPLPLGQARAKLDLALETYLNFAPLPDEEAQEDESDPTNTWPVLIPRLEVLPDEGSDSDDDDPTDEELAEVVEAFLTSPHGRSLPNRAFARSWAWQAVDWAVDHAWAPTWFGPLALSELVQDQAGEHSLVADEEMPALRATITAWAHHTADVRGLPAEARQQWDEALPEIWDDFQRAYRLPASVAHRKSCDEVIALRDYLAERDRPESEDSGHR
jgi:hypothetical protein